MIDQFHQMASHERLKATLSEKDNAPLPVEDVGNKENNECR